MLGNELRLDVARIVLSEILLESLVGVALQHADEALLGRFVVARAVKITQGVRGHRSLLRRSIIAGLRRPGYHYAYGSHIRSP